MIERISVANLPTSDEIKKGLNFKYYSVGGNSFLRATYIQPKQSYEHSILVVINDELSSKFDQKIKESLLAMQTYVIENPEDSAPPEIVRSNPRQPNKPIEEGKSEIVTPKTPREIEKENEEEADRLAGL